MMEKRLESLANPMKSKLLLVIDSHKRMTAKQLAEVCPDIPQTTLYRYLKTMTADGILTIVEERPIRGTVEKVYALSPDFSVDIAKIVEENNGQAYLLLFTQFMMGLQEEFREYTSRSDIDILQDGSAFSLAPIYVTKEEWETAAHKIGEVIMELMKQESTPERGLHNLGIILTPPKEVREKEDGP